MKKTDIDDDDDDSDVNDMQNNISVYENNIIR